MLMLMSMNVMTEILKDTDSDSESNWRSMSHSVGAAQRWELHGLVSRMYIERV